MTLRKLSLLGAALMAALALSILTATAATAAESVYHPNAQSRTFSDRSGGWSRSAAAGGPCVIALLCPTVENTYRPAGGAGGFGDGFIRSEFGPLLGVAGRRSAAWTSPRFVYRGADGEMPDEVSFDLSRRADVDALLSVTGTAATYTADLLDQKTGNAVNLTGPLSLGGAANWSQIPTVSVNPKRLVVGRSYRIRITSDLTFGVDALPNSTVDYDNVVLTAATDGTRSADCEKQINGTARPDDLTGSLGGDIVKGFKADDTIQALNGADCLFGGPGNDLLAGSTGPDQVRGNDGNDTVRGGPGNDLLAGGSEDDDVAGAGGADDLRGNDGDDVLKGGADPDRLSGGSGRDVLKGLSDRDTIKGSGGKDAIKGGGGRDVITGGAGRDSVSGGAGRDSIQVRGGGRDKVNCGPGRDRVVADRKDRVGAGCERVRLRA